MDAASSIDAEDPDWHLLTAVETAPDGEAEVLGFATCYRHYHYPAGNRLKLAQILVLPSHQGRGVGGMLLGAAQKLADELEACDLAVRLPLLGGGSGGSGYSCECGLKQSTMLALLAAGTPIWPPPTCHHQPPMFPPNPPTHLLPTTTV